MRKITTYKGVELLVPEKGEKHPNAGRPKGAKNVMSRMLKDAVLRATTIPLYLSKQFPQTALEFESEFHSSSFGLMPQHNRPRPWDARRLNLPQDRQSRRWCGMLGSNEWQGGSAGPEC